MKIYRAGWHFKFPSWCDQWSITRRSCPVSPPCWFEEEDLKKRCCSLIWRREHLCRGEEELGHRYYLQSLIGPVCIIFYLKKIENICVQEESCGHHQLALFLRPWQRHMHPWEKEVKANMASFVFKDCVCTWSLVFRGGTKLMYVFQSDKTEQERLEQCFEYYSTLNESPVLEA